MANSQGKLFKPCTYYIWVFYYVCSASITKSHVLLSMQISWLMQITLGTSPTETLSVAGNIFVGQVLQFNVYL